MPCFNKRLRATAVTWSKQFVYDKPNQARLPLAIKLILKSNINHNCVWMLKFQIYVYEKFKINICLVKLFNNFLSLAIKLKYTTQQVSTKQLIFYTFRFCPKVLNTFSQYKYKTYKGMIVMLRHKYCCIQDVKE